MIKMTVREATEVQMAIGKCPKLVAKSAYWLGRIGAKCAQEAHKFQRKQNALIKQFGSLDEKTKNISVPPEKFTEYQQEIEKVLDETVEIEINPIHPRQFVNAQGLPVEIDASTMAAMMPVLTHETNDEGEGEAVKH